MEKKRQLFTREQVISIIEDALQRPDMLIDATHNEETEFDADSILEIGEAELITPEPKSL